MILEAFVCRGNFGSEGKPRQSRENCAREKERVQVGTSQNPKPQNNPPKKQAIKVGKGKDKVIVQSGSDENTAIVATSETTRSLERRSSQGGKGDEGSSGEKTEEARPNTPSGFHEYPNPIQEKENLVKAKALVEECQATQVETRVPVDIKFPKHQKYPTHRAPIKVPSIIAELNED